MPAPPAGLKNVANTCYLNSTLQCLLCLPELGAYYANQPPPLEPEPEPEPEAEAASGGGGGTFTVALGRLVENARAAAAAKNAAAAADPELGTVRVCSVRVA